MDDDDYDPMADIDRDPMDDIDHEETGGPPEPELLQETGGPPEPELLLSTPQMAKETEGPAEPELPLSLPVLRGHWQQLQGIPRKPKAAGVARFLAWSEKGHVAVFPENGRFEAHYSAQEGQPQRFGDSIGLNMAALSSKACCLASDAAADGGSQLTIRPAERWEKAVFSAPLSAGEAVEAVACGESFVAALTSKRMLRLYSHSGLPLSLLSTAGRSVAMAAHGQFLLVVTGAPGQRAPGEGEEDPLEYRLIDVASRTPRAAGRLPLSPQARLRWLGFSEEAVPLTIDTCGVVRALIGTGAGSWGAPRGGGGEWSVILELAEEEERRGPLWAVQAKNGILFCAEVGLEAMEPLPMQLPSNAGPAATEGLTAETERSVFGVGAKLHEFPWKLAVGPVTACGGLAEAALREQLLAQHVEELDAERAANLGKAWRAKAFQLYGKLVQVGEVEKALDAARHLIAAGGAVKPLTLARGFAEKAGCFRLADEVAALAAAAADGAEPAGTGSSKVGAAAAVPTAGAPQAINSELPPLMRSASSMPVLNLPPKLGAPTGLRSAMPLEQASIARAGAPGSALQDTLSPTKTPPPSAAAVQEVASPPTKMAIANPFARRPRPSVSEPPAKVARVAD